jgi:hypothetical protein
MRLLLLVVVVVLAIALSPILRRCHRQVTDRLYRRMGLRRVVVHMSMAPIGLSSILLMDIYAESRRRMASPIWRIR